jgi:hypothetical protein
MFCSKCGTALPEEAAFCFKCGQAVKPTPPVSAETPEGWEESSLDCYVRESPWLGWASLHVVAEGRGPAGRMVYATSDDIVWEFYGGATGRRHRGCSSRPSRGIETV